MPDVREPHSKWLQDASPASGSVERFSSEWLPLLAAVPAHWSQSSLHGSGFDPFICEKFSRARHSALTVEIAELRLDRANSRGFFPSTCRGHRGLAQRHSASMSGWERPGSGVCARASSSRMILTSRLYCLR